MAKQQSLPSPADSPASTPIASVQYEISVAGRCTVTLAARSASEALELYNVGREPLPEGTEVKVAVVGS